MTNKSYFYVYSGYIEVANVIGDYHTYHLHLHSNRTNAKRELAHRILIYRQKELISIISQGIIKSKVYR
jgi:hypothetical protein